MKKIILLMIIVVSLSGCTLSAEDDNENEPVQNVESKELPENAECVKYIERIVCGKDIDRRGVQGTWEAIIRAELYYVKYKSPDYKTACLKSQSLGNVYNFLPKKGTTMLDEARDPDSDNFMKNVLVKN